MRVIISAPWRAKSFLLDIQYCLANTAKLFHGHSWTSTNTWTAFVKFGNVTTEHSRISMDHKYKHRHQHCTFPKIVLYLIYICTSTCTYILSNRFWIIHEIMFVFSIICVDIFLAWVPSSMCIFFLPEWKICHIIFVHSLHLHFIQWQLFYSSYTSVF